MLAAHGFHASMLTPLISLIGDLTLQVTPAVTAAGMRAVTWTRIWWNGPLYAAEMWPHGLQLSHTMACPSLGTLVAVVAHGWTRVLQHLLAEVPGLLDCRHAAKDYGRGLAWALGKSADLDLAQILLSKLPVRS